MTTVYRCVRVWMVQPLGGGTVPPPTKTYEEEGRQLPPLYPTEEERQPTVAATGSQLYL